MSIRDAPLALCHAIAIACLGACVRPSVPSASPATAIEPPATVTPSSAIANLVITEESHRDAAVGREVTIIGVQTRTKMPTVCGVDVDGPYELSDKKVIVRGVLHRNVVTNADRLSANRGNGTFYSVVDRATGQLAKPALHDQSAVPVRSPQLPRARLIQCPSHSLGASLALAEDGTHYTGYARDNYEDTKYASCTYSPQEIRCDGTWAYSHDSARLVITPAAGGKMTAHLTRSGGHDAVFECVAPDHDLGPCVLNPGTSSCKEAPWSQGH